MKKIITACLGHVDDLAAITRLSGQNVDVVAVAFDLGGGPDLRELHDQAIAAAAARCHMLDVREEFARERVLPAIHGDSSGADPDETIVGLAHQLIARKLAEIAGLEGTAEVIAVSQALGDVATI